MKHIFNNVEPSTERTNQRNISILNSNDDFSNILDHNLKKNNDAFKNDEYFNDKIGIIQRDTINPDHTIDSDDDPSGAQYQRGYYWNSDEEKSSELFSEFESSLDSWK